MALSIAQPASAISINDPVAAAAGGIPNYYDSTNQFPNTVSLFTFTVIPLSSARSALAL
jgi:hypothetical protein